jgi:hypothetical protein
MIIQSNALIYYIKLLGLFTLILLFSQSVQATETQRPVVRLNCASTNYHNHQTGEKGLSSFEEQILFYADATESTYKSKGQSVRSMDICDLRNSGSAKYSAVQTSKVNQDEVILRCERTWRNGEKDLIIYSISRLTGKFRSDLFKFDNPDVKPVQIARLDITWSGYCEIAQKKF